MAEKMPFRVSVSTAFDTYCRFLGTESLLP